jgi:acyl-coenzyme A synthetase/AMP-(fatty) acid ligase
MAYRGGVPIRVRQFLADVRQVAAVLGTGRHVLNVCADRYRFTVGLAASLVSGKISLLPPTHTPEVIRQLKIFAPDVVCLTDESDSGIALPHVHYPAPDEAPREAPVAVPQIERNQQVAYVFTSGSTGTPVPHKKSWGHLIDAVRMEAARLELTAACAIVATVPPQHMYGFESSVLMALSKGFALSAERPFYPADIVATLAALPRPRVLVTTPVHLRALLASGLALPQTDLVVSSTAPLAQQLAIEVERRYSVRLLEIYGSTETGAIAVRQPTQGAEWRLWRGISLTLKNNETWARGGHIEEPTRMFDVLELTGPERFLLHGRLADLVNVAGKRSSLSYLNHQLNSIPGVIDGAFFHCEESHTDHGVTRVAACVVAPELDAPRLLAALRERIDPLFLPRPLLFVARLPRNSTGKLPQEALRSLAAAQLRTAAGG